MKKLRSRSGETLAEVLIAVLIVSLTFLFLSGAVVSASKVNASVKNEEVAFKVAGGGDTVLGISDPDGRVSVTIGGAFVSGVTLYQTGNGYYYYE